MKYTRTLIAASACFLLASCNADPNERSYASGSEAEAAATPPDVASDSSGALSLTDPARKILRTADLRCRVSDAYTAAAKLESTIRSLGGAVTESRLEAVEGTVKEIPLGSDSLRQLRTYTTTARLTLRVPVASLDSVVQLVPQGALFLHHRTLAQEDATLRYLAAELKNRAGDRTEAALAKARRTSDVMQAADYETGRLESHIDRKVQNLDILDRAAHATLTVEYYQPQSIDAQVVVNPRAVARIPLGERMAGALRTGWRGLEGLAILLVAFWPLWVLGAGGWMLYRTLRRRTKLSLVMSK